MRTENINEYIHCIWYCINSERNRIDENEIEFLKPLHEETRYKSLPIIVILTITTQKPNSIALMSNIEKRA